MRHPSAPENLRGTYAGLAHPRSRATTTPTVDNEISWFDWEQMDNDLRAFVTRIIAFHKEPPNFQRRRRFLGRAVRGVSDIGCFTPGGREMTDDDWQVGFARTVGVFLNGKAIPTPDDRGEPTGDDSFDLLFNAYQKSATFTLPTGPWGDRWARIMDTADPPRPPQSTGAERGAADFCVGARGDGVERID